MLLCRHRPPRHMYNEMLSWMEALDGVPQDPRYHPEGDALFHSLQVFDVALAARAPAIELAAALLHDVGKATSGPEHAEVGADLIAGWVPEPTRWLVAHHLDLLRRPRETRALWLGSPALAALERLRHWDLSGRNPRARVRSPEEAVSIVIEALESADTHGSPS